MIVADIKHKFKVAFKPHKKGGPNIAEPVHTFQYFTENFQH